MSRSEIIGIKISYKGFSDSMHSTNVVHGHGPLRFVALPLNHSLLFERITGFRST